MDGERLCLGVQSRHLMGWIDDESIRLCSPSFADELVGREPFEGLQSAAEIIGVDEVLEMAAQLVVVVIVEAFDGCFLDGSVHALDLSVIRYVIGGVLFVLLFFSLNGLMVSPSGTWGTGSTKVRAGRR